jgi:hypothetical protein
MGQLDDVLIAKQAEVRAAKNASAIELAQEKFRIQSSEDILNTTATSAAINAFGKVGATASTMTSTSPIVESNGAVSKHQDGTYSVITEQGQTLTHLDEVTAKELSAYTREDARAIRAEAPDSFIGTRANAFGQTAIDLGVQGASAFTGETTLQGRVNIHNRQDASPQALGPSIPGTNNISDADIERYNDLKNETDLTPEDIAYIASSKYQTISRLESEATRNQSQFNAIKEFGANVKESIPVNRADQVAAAAAFEVIAKNDGNLAAAWNAVTEDLGTFVEQGIDSIPYMIAFTAGGPITQSVVLATLATGKSNQAIEEFKTKNNKEPTASELTRIKNWAAVSVVAEKFGDLAAVRAIPIARLKWAQGVQKRVNESLPGSVVNLAVVRPTVALTGEGISGASTEAAEQLAQSGEITDTGKIGYAAVAEALGTPGGLGGMVAGNLALKAVKGTTDAITADSRKAALEEQLSQGATIADTVEGAEIQARIQEIAELNDELATLTARLAEPNPDVLTGEARVEAEAALAKLTPAPDPTTPRQAPEVSPVNQDAQQEAQERATQEAELEASRAEEKPITDEGLAENLAKHVNIDRDDVTISDLKVAEQVLKAMLARKLSPTQKETLATANEVFQRKVKELTNQEVTEPTELGSLKLVDDASLEHLIDIKENAPFNLDAAEIAVLDAAIEAKQLEATLEESDGSTAAKTLEEVHKDVTEGGVADKWIGFKTYLQLISDINDEEVTGPVEAGSQIIRIEAIKSKMKLFLKNREARKAALEEAVTTTPEPGNEVIVRSYKAEGWNPQNRVIDYVVEQQKSGTYNPTDKNSTKYAYKITGRSASLINTVQTEIDYGTKMIELANSYDASAFNRNAKKQVRDKAGLQQAAESINAQVEASEEINELDDIDSIGDPAPRPVLSTEEIENVPTATRTAETDSSETAGIETIPAATGQSAELSEEDGINRGEESIPTEVTESQSEPETSGTAAKVVKDIVQTIKGITFTFVPKGDKRLITKTGAVVLALSKKDTVSTALAVHSVIMQQGITKEQVLEYIAGIAENLPPWKGSVFEYVSTQKKVVNTYMQETYNINLPALINEMTIEQVRRFIVEHELSHIQNKDRDTYYDDTAQTLAGKDANVDNIYLADSAIKIEARANLDALKILGLISDSVIETEEQASEGTDATNTTEIPTAARRSLEHDSIALPQAIIESIKAGTLTTTALVAALTKSTNPLYAEIAKKLQSTLKDFPVKYSEGPIDLRGDGSQLVLGLASYNGTADNRTPKDMTLSEPGLNEEIAIHELLHLATIQDYSDPITKVQQQASSKLLRIAARLREYLAENKDKLSAYDQKMLTVLSESTEADELITYGLTSKHAQRLLKSLPALGRTQGTLWTQFANTLRHLLKLSNTDNTLFAEVLEASTAFVDPKGESVAIEPEVSLLSESSFLDTTTSTFPEVIKPKAGYVFKQILGKIFPQLIKSKATKGIANIPTEVFEDSAKLTAALQELGLSPKAARELATKEFPAFRELYSQLVSEEFLRGEDFTDGASTNIAMTKPLSLLHTDGSGKVPVQVQFAMMIAGSSWVNQHPNNVVFQNDRARAQFLYGEQRERLVGKDSEILKSIGHSYIDATNDVGANVAHMLGFAPADKDSAAYYERLIPALGMATLEALNAEKEGNPIFSIQRHEWNFDHNPDGDYAFTAGNGFLHIMRNMDNAPSTKTPRDRAKKAEETASITESVDLFGSSFDASSAVPLLEPADETVSFIRNSRGGVPSKLKSTLAKLQKVKWTKSDTMGVFTGLAAKHMDVLHMLAGVQPEHKSDPEVRRLSIEASNLDKTMAIDDLLEQDEAGNLNDGFFFKYKLMNHHRIMMQGKINPQNSHVTRWLVKPFDTIKYTKENIHQFQLAVLMNLGYGVDKKTPEELTEAFDDLVNNSDPVLWDSVYALAAKDMDKLAELLPAIVAIHSKDGADNMSILSALTGLAAYQSYHANESKSFDSDISMEIDGVTNGFAINLLQFPTFEDAETLEKRLNQTGTYFGRKLEETTHRVSGIFSDLTSNPDVYLDLGQLVQKAGEDASLYVAKNEKRTEAQYRAANGALSSLFTDLADPSKYRNIVKYPFMIYQYGGGVKSISEGIAKDIVLDLYRQVGEMQREYNDIPRAQTETRQQYLNDVVGAFDAQLNALDIPKVRGKVGIAIKNNKSSTFSLPDSALMTGIGRLLAPRFESALEEMLGSSAVHRKTVIQTAEAIHAVFLQHYQAAQEAELAKPENQHLKALTTRQKNDLLKGELIKLLPQYRGPLMDLEAAEFVDLSKTGNPNSGSLKDASESVIFTYDKPGAKNSKTSRESSQNRKEFIAPGVSALIRMIINMDASLAASSLDSNPDMLMLYDAFLASPAALQGVSETYGKNYLKFGRSHSIVDSITTQLRDVISQSNPDILAKADNWLKSNAFGANEDTSLDNALAEAEQSLVNVTIARDKLFAEMDARGVVSHQMHMANTNPNAPASYGDRMTAEEAILAEAKEKAFYANDQVTALTNRARMVLRQAVDVMGIDGFLDNFQSYTADKAYDFIPFAAADPSNNPQTASVLQALSSIVAGDTATERGVLSSILTGEGHAALVAAYEDTLTPQQLANQKAAISAELQRYTFSIPFTEQEAVHEQAVREIAEDMLSLDNLQRDNFVDTHRGSITSNNVMRLFNKFNTLARPYYSSDSSMTAHTAVLQKTMSLLSKSINEIGNIKLTIEQIDGITQGGFETSRKKMRISLSRTPPASANGQSAQEVYVHEMVHAVTSTVLKAHPLIAGRVRKAFDQTKAEIRKNGGYKVFLGDIARPTQADVDMAKAQYKYLFDNPTNEANKLDEFFAYALTNKAMVQYLQNNFQSLPVRDPGIIGNLLHIFDIVVDAFVRMMRRDSGNNQYQDMISVLEQITEVHNKHANRAELAIQKAKQTSDKLDEKIREGVSKTAELINTSNPERGRIRKATNAVIGGAVITLTDNAAKLRVNRSAQELLSRTTQSIYNELGNGTLTKPLIQVLLNARNIINKAVQTTERDVINQFNNMWVSTKAEDISVATREALTSVMLRTDISSLLDISMTPQQIATIMGDSKLVAIAQKNILQELRKHGVTGRAIKYTQELGNHIATGDTELANAHTNVYTIAKDELGTDASAEAIGLLDAYATLVSLEVMHTKKPDELALVKQLADAEFAANPQSNGITDILSYHREFTQSSIDDLFNGNPFQTYKGWIVERVDNLHSIQTGQAADKDRMARGGYKENYTMGKIPGVDSIHDTLYVSHDMPEIPFVSGIMSVTSQRSMGTTITEILAKDPKYIGKNGSTDYARIRKEVKRVARGQASAAATLTQDTSLKLRPIRDDRGNITDYRVMMNHQTKKDLLRPDTEFQNVFAHMHSTRINKMNTVINDKAAVDALVYEQGTLMKMYPEQFIDILNPKSDFHDSYRRLPKEVRDYMNQYVVDGKFMVRDSIVTKVFGYKAMDMRNWEWLQKEGRERQKWAVAMAHYLVKQTVSYGVDRIVIATIDVVANNLLSNVFQLSMRKISPVFIMRKMYEGAVEYKRYTKDTDRARELLREINAKGLSTSSPESLERGALIKSIEGNPMHKMSAAGLNSLIVEDLNEAAADGYFNRLKKVAKTEQYDKYLDKVPNSLTTIAQTLFMTKASLPYRALKEVVQLSDFLGRYVMIEHATKVKGQSFNEAMHEAIDAFVLFDENMTPALEAINSVAGTVFATYWMRNQRAALSLIKQHPSTVLTAAGVQQVTGIDALANINSSFYAGDLGPQMLQFDDLVGDKIFDIPLITNIMGD